MKPHIRKLRGQHGWICIDGIATGIGSTPAQAFEAFIDMSDFPFWKYK